MAPTAQQLRDVVDENLRRAESALSGMRLDEKLAKSMVKDLPRFRALELGDGASAWAAVLFVDLRGSTKRAQSIGARKTYLTMHALLPALAFGVQEFGGYVVGFRGDGLFGVFGMGPNGFNEANYDQPKIVQRACRCGQWMIEGVDEVVGPALESRGVLGHLRIGVGVDSGTIIVTRIGFRFADEVTAYGDAVNTAAKISDVSDSAVTISERVDELFPTSKSGKVQRFAVPEYPSWRRVVFPSPILSE